MPKSNKQSQQPKSNPRPRDWQIEISSRGRLSGRLNSLNLRKTLLKILNHLDSSLSAKQRADPSINCLNITFCNDQQIRQLNRSYRGKDKATDVLSFSMIENGHLVGEQLALGDLVISIPTCLKQAQMFKHPPSKELLKLLVHGILHLHGFDHENVTQRKRMQMKRWENKLLKSFGTEKGLLTNGKR